ncbi:serine/threonine-protein kinase [Panacagrimonas perspica]|uniref:non-specific serine/threonine protein kinase n=1 Tax=Panacagrimonas perspica TaxID=381431 RepID=A0A4S3K3I7_9GAMM|nr:protein kinase [Panacagrimonas perspica]TDU28889.1 serine/threonine-protein kinase [Panacagrimonas perspica]THD02284.1 hypothetical protein B1810_15260 [Panacagrimonas perspica]
MNAWTDAVGWDGEWEPQGQLPAGGQGVVKHVRHRVTGQAACLKILSRQSDPERRARFFREATAYATCLHAGIPRLVSSNANLHEDPKRKLFLVIDFVEGPTIAEHVGRNGPLPFDEAAAIVLRLLEIVGYVHGEGWVHRDIKPDNIILRASSPADPVLLDFGLGYRDGASNDFRTEQGQEIGNRFLRLPELSAGSPAKQDVRTDLAFLGGIFFFLLTATSPATLLDQAGRMPHQRAEATAAIRLTAGPALNVLLSFFDRTFSQKISGRFESANAMRKELEAVVHRQNRPASEPEDDLDLVMASLNTVADRELAKNKQRYERVMNVVREVHAEILRKVSSTYRSYAGGHVDFTQGLRNRLGFHHFATHDKRYAPEFLIRVEGEELVVLVDGTMFYRTDVEEPVLDDAFRRSVRDLYVAGLRDLTSGEGA